MIRAVSKCAICGERKALPSCPVHPFPLCRTCHAHKRLAYRCPCMTVQEAIDISETAADPDAAKRALTAIAALLRPEVPSRAPKSASGNPQPHR